MFGGGFFGGGGPFGGFGGGGRFETSYRCYPVSFIDKPEAERGNKIFLPPSALDRLAQLHIEYPMLFQLENRRDGRRSHCGVLEFIADEGMVYLPYWMMQNLLLSEGDVVTLRSASLPKGTYVKLQPHSSDFLDISNPRAVLETTMRNFACLTVGDTIPINYNNKKYFIDIVEAKPQDAISVIETDCQVDFAAPLDYVEPEPVPRQAAAAQAAGEAGTSAATAAGATGQQQQQQEQQHEAEPEQPSFLAFSGTGKRLDGKAVSEAAPVTIPIPGNRPRAGGGPASSSNDVADSAPKSGNTSQAGSAPKRPGKVMYSNRLQQKLAEKGQQQQGGGGGSSSGAAAAAPPKPPKPEEAGDTKKEEEEEGSKFKAFQGKGYSLK